MSRREDYVTTDPDGAAAFERINGDPGLPRGWDVTADDVPTGGGDDELGWWAAFLASRGGAA